MFKLLAGVPATESQLTVPVVTPPIVTGPRLSTGDVPSLARMNEEYSRVIDHVLPSLVMVETEGKQQQRAIKYVPPADSPEWWTRPLDPSRMTEGYALMEFSDVGSGVFISQDGYIITNHHLVFGAAKIFVTTQEKERYKAELIGADLQRDIAILMLLETGEQEFPVLNFADSDRVKVGEMVLAIGNPYGLTGSVTQGVISGTHRRFEKMSDNDFFQTDAAINPGNSGGPLVNIFGEIIGINVILYSPHSGTERLQGVGLTLPSNQVIETYQYIRERGQRTRAFFGATFNELTEEQLAEVGLDGRGAVRLLEIIPNSPAEEAKIKSNDIMTEVGGTEVASVAQALAVLGDWDPKVPLNLKLWRDENEVEVTVKLTQINEVNQLAVLPAPLGKEGSPAKLKESLKVELYKLSMVERQQIGLPPGFGGIAVPLIAPDSPLNGHLLPWDVIHRINGKAIWSEEEFYDALANLPADKESRVVLTRNQRRYYLELRPE